ncbi:MAG: DinB family protein [Cyclobacteriaceae bacterium]
MERTKWTERIFTFDFPEGLLPNVLERLRGVESRLKAMTHEIDDAVTLEKKAGKWSIREHIGHLVDLEDIHMGRVREMMAGKPELTAADMKNVKTEEAEYNTKNINDLIAAFTIKRNNFIQLLESLDDETQHFQSLHPRLQVRMRPVDMAFFIAEHDDHHLTSIREILKKQPDPLNLTP